MRKNGVRALAAGVALTAVLAGCGSDDDKGSSSSTSSQSGAAASTTATTKQASGAPIKYMIIVPVQTVQSQPLPEAVADAKAAAKAINAAGGVKGRPIAISFCDEKGVPTQATACARKAVSDKVDAVFLTSNFGATIQPILTAANIPAVGSNPYTPSDGSDPNSFPMIPGSDIYHTAVPFLVKQAGKNSLAAATYDIANAQQKAVEMKASSPKAGVDFKGFTAFPATTTDWSPVVQKLKKMGAEAVSLVTAGQAIPPIIKTANQFGYKPQWVGNPTGVTPEIIKQLGSMADGMLFTSPLPPLDDPRLKQFNDEIAAAKASGIDNTAATYPGVVAWLGTHGLAAIADKVQGEINGKSLTDALNAAKEKVAIPAADFINWIPGADGPKGYEQVSNSTVYPLGVKDGKVIAEGDPVNVFQQTGLQ